MNADHLRGPTMRALVCTAHPGAQVRRVRTRGPRGPGMYLRCVPADGSPPHLVGWPGAVAATRRAPLSDDELHVLHDAAEGLTIIETAAKRETTPQSVKLQRANVLLKLGARNTAHAVAIGMRERLVHVDTQPVVRRPQLVPDEGPLRVTAVPAGPGAAHRRP